MALELFSVYFQLESATKCIKYMQYNIPLWSTQVKIKYLKYVFKGAVCRILVQAVNETGSAVW